jgi:hypothetical protein
MPEAWGAPYLSHTVSRCAMKCVETIILAAGFVPAFAAGLSLPVCYFQVRRTSLLKWSGEGSRSVCSSRHWWELRKSTTTGSGAAIYLLNEFAIVQRTAVGLGGRTGD